MAASCLASSEQSCSTTLAWQQDTLTAFFSALTSPFPYPANIFPAGQGGEAIQCQGEHLCLGSALGHTFPVALLQLQSRLPGSKLNLTDGNRFDGTSCIIKSGLFKSCKIFNLERSTGKKKKKNHAQLFQRFLCRPQGIY